MYRVRHDNTMAVKIIVFYDVIRFIVIIQRLYKPCIFNIAWCQVYIAGTLYTAK